MFPARKIEKGWAVKTPRGRLLLHTAGLLKALARENFRGYLGIESWAQAAAKGYRVVRVVLHEPTENRSIF